MSFLEHLAADAAENTAKHGAEDAAADATKHAAEDAAADVTEKGGKLTTEALKEQLVKAQETAAANVKRLVSAGKEVTAEARKVLENVGEKMTPENLEKVVKYVGENPKLVAMGITGTCLAGYMIVNGISDPFEAALDMTGDVLTLFLVKIFGKKWKRNLVICIILLLVFMMLVSEIV